MNRILVVEDNEMNRDMLVRRLERAGFEVLFAINGQEAVEMSLKDAPELILMDMSLPIMDGWEATRRIRKELKTKDIPIIALTAHAMKNDLESTLEAGCNDYDCKPIDFARLMEKIHQFLPKKPLGDE